MLKTATFSLHARHSFPICQWKTLLFVTPCHKLEKISINIWLREFESNFIGLAIFMPPQISWDSISSAKIRKVPSLHKRFYLGPLHFESQVNWADSVSKNLPHHSFLDKNFSVVMRRWADVVTEILVLATKFSAIGMKVFTHKHSSPGNQDENFVTK